MHAVRQGRRARPTVQPGSLEVEALVVALGRPVRVAGVCHGVCVGEDLWDAYDRTGLSFLQHAADSAHNAHYDRPAVLAALGPVAGRQVLDAACGPGLYLRELLERGAEVTGFDASPVMVALARQQTLGRVRIDQAVLGQPLPYRDGAFDLIVCALAIHYARDRAAAFGEFCRVLRPGGAAVVSTQHPVMDWLRKGGSYFQTTPGNRHLAHPIGRPAPRQHLLLKAGLPCTPAPRASGSPQPGRVPGATRSAGRRTVHSNPALGTLDCCHERGPPVPGEERVRDHAA
jgi:SAM-dependent methyltransferase